MTRGETAMVSTCRKVYSFQLPASGSWNLEAGSRKLVSG
jgi:hypothetical protein